MERVVARKRKEKQEAAIKKAFASMLEGDDNARASSNDTDQKKKKKKKRGSISIITGRPRRSSSVSSSVSSRKSSTIGTASPGMNRREEIAANEVLNRRVSRRASFGTTSILAIQELKKDMEAVQEEDRLQQQNRLIKAMEDCSTLSKKLDFVKNQKNRQVKMSRQTLKKLTSKNKETAMKVNAKIRKNILLSLYREKRAKWSSRPPRISTSQEESVAAAKLLLSTEGVVLEEQFEEAKAKVRVPEVWILYSTLTRQDYVKMIMRGFQEQEAETKDSATKFWETLN